MFSDSLLILTILNQNYKGSKPIRRENEMHQLYTHYILGENQAIGSLRIMYMVSM